jgi:hypothetical protein
VQFLRGIKDDSVPFKHIKEDFFREKRGKMAPDRGKSFPVGDNMLRLFLTMVEENKDSSTARDEHRHLVNELLQHDWQV